MITDFDKFSFDEVRAKLILSKELLRGLMERSPDDFSFRRYSDAYLAMCDALDNLDRVQCLAVDEFDNPIQ